MLLFARLAEVGECAGESGPARDLREVTDPIMKTSENHRGRASQGSCPMTTHLWFLTSILWL